MMTESPTPGKPDSLPEPPEGWELNEGYTGGDGNPLIGSYHLNWDWHIEVHLLEGGYSLTLLEVGQNLGTTNMSERLGLDADDLGNEIRKMARKCRAEYDK